MPVFIYDVIIPARQNHGGKLTKFCPMFVWPAAEGDKLEAAAKQLNISDIWHDEENEIYWVSRSQRKKANRLGIAKILKGPEGENIWRQHQSALRARKEKDK